MKNYLKNPKGITLIALVVTIIILIILASISLNLLLGENGIIKKVKDARNESILADAREKIILAATAALTEGEGKITYNNLNTALSQTFPDGNYTISPESDAVEWTVTRPTEAGDAAVNIDKSGTTSVAGNNGEEEQLPNPNTWVMAWTCTNEVWSSTYIAEDMTAEQIANIGNNVDIVAKLYKNDEKYIDTQYDEVIGEYDSFSLYIIGSGSMGSLADPDTNGPAAWFIDSEDNSVDLEVKVTVLATNEIHTENSLFHVTNVINKVKVCNGITNISKYAFTGFEILNEVAIGSNVSKIDEEAMAYCDNLKNITIPANVTIIDNNVFQEAGLENVNFVNKNNWYYKNVTDYRDYMNNMSKTISNLINGYYYYQGREVATSTQPFGTSSLAKANRNFLLMSDKKLYYYEPYETYNGREEFNLSNFTNIELAAENVKQMDGDYFLCENGNLYRYNTEELVDTGVKRIIENVNGVYEKNDGKIYYATYDYSNSQYNSTIIFDSWDHIATNGNSEIYKFNNSNMVDEIVLLDNNTFTKVSIDPNNKYYPINNYYMFLELTPSGQLKNVFTNNVLLNNCSSIFYNYREGFRNLEKEGIAYEEWDRYSTFLYAIDSNGKIYYISDNGQIYPVGYNTATSTHETIKTLSYNWALSEQGNLYSREGNYQYCPNQDSDSVLYNKSIRYLWIDGYSGAQESNGTTYFDSNGYVSSTSIRKWIKSSISSYVAKEDSSVYSTLQYYTAADYSSYRGYNEHYYRNNSDVIYKNYYQIDINYRNVEFEYDSNTNKWYYNCEYEDPGSIR